MKALKDRLGKDDTDNGYILDGFPRNLEQFNKMRQEGIDYKYVVYLNVSEKEVIKRLTARGRKDDKPEIIKNRLKVYEKETGPVLDKFRQEKDKFIEVRAEGKGLGALKALPADLRKLQMNIPVQPVDQQLIDEASKFLELKRTQGGKSAYQYAQDLITGT